MKEDICVPDLKAGVVILGIRDKVWYTWRQEIELETHYICEDRYYAFRERISLKNSSQSNQYLAKEESKMSARHDLIVSRRENAYSINSKTGMKIIILKCSKIVVRW